MTKYQPPYGTTNPDQGYVNGNPATGQQGSIPPAAAFENPQREIVNLITDSGQSPTDADLHQQTRAIRDGKLNFCVDSGVLNQLQVQLQGPPITSYSAGLTLRVLIAHSNTGPTRIAVGTLNPTSVKRRDGSELQPNDIVAGMVATLVCDGTYFQLQNMGAGGGDGGGDTTIMEIDIPYVHDTGTPNHLIGLYSPPLPDIREGRTVEIKLLNNTTGPTDFTPNSFPTHSVVHPDGSPIKPGDGLINQIWLLVFDGVNWQLLGYVTAAGVAPGPTVGSGKSLQLLYGSFNGSSYLKRIPTVNSNRQIWSWSAFVKRSDLNPALHPYGTQAWFNAGGAQLNSDYTGMYFMDDVNIQYQAYWLWWNNSNAPVAAPSYPNMSPGSFSNTTFTDLNWHNFLMTADGAHISAYTDGVLMAQGPMVGNGAVNSTRPHMIGSDADDLGQFYGSAIKVCEIMLVDGLCLPWTSFATSIGGIMIPKAYNGPWGVNGSYLNFADSSAATASTLGKDWSGNGNNWTPFNISIGQMSTDFPG